MPAFLYLHRDLYLTPLSIPQLNRLEELMILMHLLPTSYTRQRIHSSQKPGILSRMFVTFHIKSKVVSLLLLGVHRSY